MRPSPIISGTSLWIRETSSSNIGLTGYVGTIGKPSRPRWIAVGTPVTGHPPHRTERARFGHSAPTWVIDGEAPPGPRMEDSGLW